MRDLPVKYVLFEDEGHGWGKLESRVRRTSGSSAGSRSISEAGVRSGTYGEKTAGESRTNSR
jgi:hypothetical protein